tara:strand:- start:2768 stop:2965 length:198 start_codon:yes stop_codon:yes gene_type:complete
MEILTPEEQLKMQGDWIREQERSRIAEDQRVWEKNRRIQRNAVREYQRSNHKAITKNDSKSDEII